MTNPPYTRFDNSSRPAAETGVTVTLDQPVGQGTRSCDWKGQGNNIVRIVPVVTVWCWSEI